MKGSRAKTKAKRQGQRAIIEIESKKNQYPNTVLKKTLEELETGISFLGTTKRKFLEKMLLDGRIFADYKTRIKKILAKEN